MRSRGGTGALDAATPPNTHGSSIYITHVTVIDTKTGKETQDRTVIISGDRRQSERRPNLLPADRKQHRIVVFDHLRDETDHHDGS